MVTTSPILPSVVTSIAKDQTFLLGGERGPWIGERLEDAGNQLWRQIDFSAAQPSSTSSRIWPLATLMATSTPTSPPEPRWWFR
jgi:hypothetical protein